MRRFIGAFWGLLVCVLITMCGGCKTKKAVAVEALKSTYSSTSAVKEKTEAHYSFIDTTKMDEFTSVIREYIFDTPTFCTADSLAHGTNVGSKPPMVEYKGDGSVIINHGLRSIRETKTSRKNEKKGVSVQKDSTIQKATKTKVHATEQHRQKQKQVEQIAVSKPFDFWQLIVGVSILFAVAVALYYLYKRVPSVRNVMQRIRDRINRIVKRS